MAGMTTWASALDVQALTGRTVSDTDIDRAQAVIETLGGARVASVDPSTVSARDLDWLRRAVAYQVVFMLGRPDYFEAADVSELDQDGVSAVLKPDSIVLAPLARRCLKRLSWRGVRTLKPTRGREYLIDAPIGKGAGLPDDALGWRPM